MPIRLTSPQLTVLTALATSIAAGKVPSMRELAANLSYTSPSTVKAHIQALERAGCIVCGHHRARAIALTPIAYFALGCKIMTIISDISIAELNVTKGDFLLIEATEKATVGDYVYTVSTGTTSILPYSETVAKAVIGRVFAVVKTL